MKKLLEILKTKMEREGYKVYPSPSDNTTIIIQENNKGRSWELQVAISQYLLTRTLFAISDKEVMFFNFPNGITKHLLEKYIKGFEKNYSSDTSKLDSFVKFLRENILSVTYAPSFIKGLNLYFLDEFMPLKPSFEEELKEALSSFTTIHPLENETMKIADYETGNHYEIFIEKKQEKTKKLLLGYKESKHFTLLEFENFVPYYDLEEIILRVQANNPDWVEDDIIKAIDKNYPISQIQEFCPNNTTYVYEIKE